MVWRSAQQLRDQRRLLFLRRSGHNLNQRATLVNAKLKWVKDRTLDSAVSREKHLRSILHLISLISSSKPPIISTRNLTPHLILRDPTAFLRHFPAIFTQSSPSTFALSAAALHTRDQELQTLARTESDLVDRLRRLLMLTIGRSLPLHTVDLLRFDLGLPLDYRQTLLPRYPQFFSLVQPPGDERLWLSLLSWDPHLAVSELQKSSSGQDRDKYECLAFPVSFTRGFGMRKKCVEWLREWQTLPYTNPYAGPSGLDPRTDVAEKRMVGVFHELLHLMIGKKTERRNVSNMRKPLGLPQKFTKVFERHPGIFYISLKLATQTVVLREAFGGRRELIEKHPLVEVREKYLELMRVRREEMENVEGEEGGDESEDSDGCLVNYNSLDEE